MAITATATQVRGSLPEIIRNDRMLYEGNLISYFHAVFTYAQNLHHPYHNFRHMFHVVWLCYQACLFYRTALSPREMRNLLIAAMFHDFDHSGMMGNDDLNIARSVRGFQKHIVAEDHEHAEAIIGLIEATEYPYRISSDKFPLSAKILRDADLSQAFSPAWVQQVVFGLAAEWNKSPIDVLRAQGPFCRTLKFYTEWGQQTFSKAEIEAKLAEAMELLVLLEEKQALST